MGKTSIEWTDATWNPVGGCSIHSPGCNGCYAMKLAASPRLNKHPLYAGTTEIVKGKAVWNGKLTQLPDDHDGWTWPLRWRGATNPAHPPKLGQGKPSLIFVGDMTDVFHKGRSRGDIDRIVATILLSPHIGQLLTKRPDAMAQYFYDPALPDRLDDMMYSISGEPWPLAERGGLLNRRLWLGCSVERQQEAEERHRFMKFIANMGFTTFVSYEPALGPVDWRGWEFLKQLIAGGMSGSEATPSHPDWFRAARDWCAANGIAFFFKQWGEWCPEGQEQIAEYGGCEGKVARETILDNPVYHRVGRNRAGRLLDGIEHNGFPEVA